MSSFDQVRKLSHLSRERVLGHSLQAERSTSHHVGGSEVNPAGVPTDSYIVNLIFIFTRTVTLQARYTYSVLYGRVKSADEEEPSEATLSVEVVENWPPIIKMSPGKPLSTIECLQESLSTNE